LGGKMAQTMYAHMNKWIKKKVKKLEKKGLQCNSPLKLICPATDLSMPVPTLSISDHFNYLYFYEFIFEYSMHIPVSFSLKISYFIFQFILS
jgi:hypothetical protein